MPEHRSPRPLAHTARAAVPRCCASYFLCLCKESKQRKHTPGSASFHGEAVKRCPALLAATGVPDRHALRGVTVLDRHPCRSTPLPAAMLGAPQGGPTSTATAGACRRFPLLTLAPSSKPSIAGPDDQAPSGGEAGAEAFSSRQGWRVEKPRQGREAQGERPRLCEHCSQRTRTPGQTWPGRAQRRGPVFFGYFLLRQKKVTRAAARNIGQPTKELMVPECITSVAVMARRQAAT